MKRSNLVWVVIAVLVVALLGTGIFIYMQHKEMSDFKEQVEIDKQRSELEKEYSDLAAQYDQFEGQKMMFNNDSLIEKLDAEKVKVQRLLEELRTVKNTSSARIEELKRELTTLRGIMRHYVMQIDSLNVANKQLREGSANSKSIETRTRGIDRKGNISGKTRCRRYCGDSDRFERKDCKKN